MPEKRCASPDRYDKKINFVTGKFTEDVYKEYIKNHLSTKENNLVEIMLNSSEDKYIEYINIGLKSELSCCFNQLLLLKIYEMEYSYLPIFINNINTSSPFALMMLNTYDEDEDEKCITLMNLSKLIIKKYDIKKIITMVCEQYS
jgi:hypothetical protein